MSKKALLMMLALPLRAIPNISRSIAMCSMSL